MTDNSRAPGKDDPPAASPAAALRLRLWLACLGGALVAGGGIWWVIGTQVRPAALLDLPGLVSWLAAVAGLGLLVGAAFALWLDRGIVAHTRGLAEAVANRQVARLRGLPAAWGWGELSQLTLHIQQLLTHYRRAERAADDFGLVRDQLNVLRAALEKWNESERWPRFKTEAGPATLAVEALNRGLRRLDDVREQNYEAARQIVGELSGTLETARGSAEQAERGFVEATALLTSVRELQRLQVALAESLGRGEPAAPEDAARGAVEELATASVEAVEQIGRAMLKVDGIAEQVAMLGNRATLVALNSTFLAGSRVADDLAEDTRRLVEEVRAAVDRVAALARDLDGEVAAAAARMRDVRERVARKLEPLPAPGGAPAESARLLERMREMIQDATRKGERVSASGESVSRAAEALERALQEQWRELQGLVARLAPPELPETGPERTEEPGRSTPASPEPPGLRVLGEGVRPPERPERRRAPGQSEERR